MTDPKPLVDPADVVVVLRGHRVDVLGGCSCGARYSERCADGLAALEHLGEAIAAMVVEKDRVRAQLRGNAVARGTVGPTRVLACELDLIHLGRQITAHTGRPGDTHDHVGALLTAEQLDDPRTTVLHLGVDEGIVRVEVQPGSWVELA